MQNVDVIKSHYLKGKQLFWCFCESYVVSAQDMSFISCIGSKNRGENIAVIEPQNVMVLLDKYEVYMER